MVGKRILQVHEVLLHVVNIDVVQRLFFGETTLAIVDGARLLVDHTILEQLTLRSAEALFFRNSVQSHQFTLVFF